ncbi:MAG: folylpolyglutamate synthase/dihydrofolate synthase family protein [Stappiaceae bacterium]
MDHTTAILQRLLKLHPRSIDLSLSRMTRILDAIGNPERHLPPVFHVAGTNGKGSTSAYLRAFLEASGRSVHVYTSPHLVNFNERIRLSRPEGGRFVSGEALADALRRCEDANKDEPITFFEITTAAAFLLFAEHPADALVLEVGLGGRLDATNVIERPEVSVITSISMDHEQWLGADLEGIALEKAGILKSGVPAVMAPQTDVVRRVIEQRAQELGAPIIIGGQDFTAFEEHGRLVFQNNERLMDLPLPILPGTHQYDNAALAIATLGASRFWSGSDAVEKGLRQVVWPARMQRLSRGPLIEMCPKDSELWLDGGHNPGAGAAMARVFADLNEVQSRPLYLIAGMLNTKDPSGYFSAFEGLVRHVITVPINSSEAGRTAEELCGYVESTGLNSEPGTTLQSALGRISELAREDEISPRILICGSLYLAGDALAENGTVPE